MEAWAPRCATPAAPLPAPACCHLPLNLQADVGLKAREDSKQFAFLNDKPPPLQLERIEEDAALQGAPAA